MISLLRVELQRLRWRRAVLLLLGAAVLVPTLVVAGTLWTSRPATDQERAYAQAQVEREVATGAYDREADRCVRRPGRYGIDPGLAGDDAGLRAACEDVTLPQVDWFLSRTTGLDLTVQREYGAGITIAVVLALLSALVGTTFAGHDWASGSMSNQLLFEPRRTRIWVAKAAAVGASCLAVGLVVHAAGWGVLAATAMARDEVVVPFAVQAGFKQSVLAALLAGGVGVATYALTMLFRSTVAVLGLLLALAVGSTLLLTALGLGTQVRLLPDANATAYLVGSVTRVDYEDPACSAPTGPALPPTCTHTVDRSQSVLYLGVLWVAAVVSSLWSFRRRDVP